MPFTKLANSHRCSPPAHRDDNTNLVIGDEWRCDEETTDSSGSICGKQYRFSDSQRDGKYWMPIPHSSYDG